MHEQNLNQKLQDYWTTMKDLVLYNNEIIKQNQNLQKYIVFGRTLFVCGFAHLYRWMMVLQTCYSSLINFIKQRTYFMYED